MVKSEDFETRTVTALFLRASGLIGKTSILFMSVFNHYDPVLGHPISPPMLVTLEKFQSW